MSASPEDGAARDDDRPRRQRPGGSDQRGPARRTPGGGGDHERRPYQPRDGKPAEGRPYTSRGDKPAERRPYKPRDGKPTEGRPHASRGDKPAERRPYGKAAEGRAYKPRGDNHADRRPYVPRGDKPPEGRPSRGGDGNPAGRPNRTRRDDERLWTKAGQPARGDRDARDNDDWVDPDPFGTRSVRAAHVDPFLRDDITADELDRVARNELKTLTPENQEYVARHLAAAARLIDSEPERAHEHAISAARRAGRIGVARETLAITAYTVGDYALALRELRTYRRITGREDQLPMMVDCERGLGRPERALELGRSVPRASLPPAVQVELAIAMSGARLDLAQPELALAELQIAQLDPATAFSYSPGLFDAYATVLDELGRGDEAAEWFRRADVASAALQGDDEDDDYIEVFEEELAVAQQEDATEQEDAAEQEVTVEPQAQGDDDES